MYDAILFLGCAFLVLVVVMSVLSAIATWEECEYYKSMTADLKRRDRADAPTREYPRE